MEEIKNFLRGYFYAAWQCKQYEFDESINYIDGILNCMYLITKKVEI